MNYKEYRIGNLVEALGEIREIEGITSRMRPDVFHFWFKELEHPFKGIHVKPVLLTEEWLFKFEHESIDLDHCEEDLSNKIGKWKTDEFFNYVIETYYNDHSCAVYICKEVKYVHQWQNLYKYLTEEELTIKS